MAVDDSEMHAMELRLETVLTIILGTLTCRTSDAVLSRIQEFVFEKQPKPPIARDITKLPLSKPLMRLKEIVRMFPRDLQRKCDARVTAV